MEVDLIGMAPNVNKVRLSSKRRRRGKILKYSGVTDNLYTKTLRSRSILNCRNITLSTPKLLFVIYDFLSLVSHLLSVSVRHKRMSPIIVVCYFSCCTLTTFGLLLVLSLIKFQLSFTKKNHAGVKLSKWALHGSEGEALTLLAAYTMAEESNYKTWNIIAITSGKAAQQKKMSCGSVCCFDLRALCSTIMKQRSWNTCINADSCKIHTENTVINNAVGYIYYISVIVWVIKQVIKSSS